MSSASKSILVYRRSIARPSGSPSVSCFSHGDSAASGSARSARASLRTPCKPFVPSTTLQLAYAWLIREYDIGTGYAGYRSLRFQSSEGQLQLAQAGIDRGIFLQNSERFMELLSCRWYVFDGVDNADGGYCRGSSGAGWLTLSESPFWPWSLWDRGQCSEVTCRAYKWSSSKQQSLKARGFRRHGMIWGRSCWDALQTPSHHLKAGTELGAKNDFDSFIALHDKGTSWDFLILITFFSFVPKSGNRISMLRICRDKGLAHQDLRRPAP